jgi:ribosomal protein L24E
MMPRSLKRCAVCGQAIVPGEGEMYYCRMVHRRCKGFAQLRVHVRMSPYKER